MTLAFEVSAIILSTPEKIYQAWLDSKQHGEMTGGAADVSAVEGEAFQAWDGYIQGKNLNLIPNQRIVQSWRTSEFEDSEEDSRLEILLEEAEGGTKLTIKHSNLPAHGGQYEAGWDESYFQPMKIYFEGQK